MTANLVNMLAAQGAPELTGQTVTPGVSTGQGPVVAVQPGQPQSFSTAMKTLGKAPGGEVSGSLLPPGAAVIEAETTQQATVLHLSLPPLLTMPTLAATPMPTEGVTGLPGEGVNRELPAGIPLPDSGNTLPAVAVLSDLRPLALNDSTVSPMTLNTGMPQQGLSDPTQVAVASVTSRPIVLDSQQLTPGMEGRRPAPNFVSTDEPSAQTMRPNLRLDPELRAEPSSSRHAQSIIKAVPMHSELIVASRAAVTADFATLMTDSGSAIFSQPASQVPLPLDQLLEPAQFQNMRPLQPTADPQTFLEGLGQRLMVMSEGGVQSARMKLYPENLGTLDIKIRVEDDAARVWFTASHGQAREALEAALPKLKELFTQQGMELVQADIGSGHDQSKTGDSFDSGDDSFPGLAGSEPDSLHDSVGPLSAVMVPKHSLDIYV